MATNPTVNKYTPEEAYADVQPLPNYTPNVDEYLKAKSEIPAASGMSAQSVNAQSASQTPQNMAEFGMRGGFENTVINSKKKVMDELQHDQRTKAFEKLLSMGQNAADLVENEAIKTYGEVKDGQGNPEVLRYLPHRQNFMKGDFFDGVEYTKRAYIGIKKFEEVQAQKQQQEKTNQAIAQAIPTSENSADAAAKMAAAGVDLGGKQAGAVLKAIPSQQQIQNDQTRQRGQDTQQTTTERGQDLSHEDRQAKLALDKQREEDRVAYQHAEMKLKQVVEQRKKAGGSGAGGLKPNEIKGYISTVEKQHNDLVTQIKTKTKEMTDIELGGDKDSSLNVKEEIDSLKKEERAAKASLDLWNHIYEENAKQVSPVAKKELAPKPGARTFKTKSGGTATLLPQ